jgi:hypothetical protein
MLERMNVESLDSRLLCTIKSWQSNFGDDRMMHDDQHIHQASARHAVPRPSTCTLHATRIPGPNRGATALYSFVVSSPA